MCSPRWAVSPFQPHRALRYGRLQTVLSRYRPRGIMALSEDEAPVVVDGGPDVWGLDPAVRLLGYYNRSRSENAGRGLIISLHGWEGSSHAIQTLVMANAFVQAGYDVFRLNLRDHGPQLHVRAQALNRGLFLGTLLEESLRAVQRIAEWAGSRPVYLVGPSMGGNFALRMAVAHAQQPIANLRQVVAISPAIHPGRSTDAIDAQTVFRLYFRRRWLHSLLIKARLFPELYDFAPLLKLDTVRAMTEWLIPRYTAYDSADAYFSDYSIVGSAAASLTVPTTIITAADDSVIPVADFYGLAPSPNLTIQIHPTGGHVGFLDVSSPLRHCLPDMVLAELAAEPPYSE